MQIQGPTSPQDIPPGGKTPDSLHYNEAALAEEVLLKMVQESKGGKTDPSFLVGQMEKMAQGTSMQADVKNFSDAFSNGGVSNPDFSRAFLKIMDNAPGITPLLKLYGAVTELSYLAGRPGSEDLIKTLRDEFITPSISLLQNEMGKFSPAAQKEINSLISSVERLSGPINDITPGDLRLLGLQTEGALSALGVSQPSDLKEAVDNMLSSPMLPITPIPPFFPIPIIPIIPEE